MTALFAMTFETETLSKGELAEITGSVRRSDQLAWLTAHEWKHFVTRAGEPVVGRLYMRLRLAGISTLGMAQVDARGPDMTKVR